MKKLLALLLAATTAISMFATSAAAIDYADEDVFTNGYFATKVEFVNGDTINVYQKYLDEDGNTQTNEKLGIKGGADLKAFVEHIELGEPYGAPEDFTEYVALNPGLANDKYGKIYMYDYALDKEVENDRTYKAALEKFADLVDEILSARTQDLPSYEADEFITAWGKAYKTSFSKDETPVRYDALTQARSNARAIRDYFDANGDFDYALFDEDDVKAYNADALFVAVKNYNTSDGPDATSEFVYLNAEYERIATEITYADTTSYMDAYYEALEKVTSYEESDFTAAGWREVQELLEEAEEVAADAVSIYDWKEATEILKEAIAVRGKAVDYTDLQEALLDLFVGEKVSAIKAAPYKGDDAEVYVYDADDFVVRGKYTQEWLDFAGDPVNGKVDGEKAAYTVAYDLYKSARSNLTSVKQSELDEALADLLDAVDALVSNADAIDEWLIVKLQAVVDKADALAETDFNTTSKKWENFQEDVEDAKEVLAKSNPSEAEVNRVTKALIGTFEGDTKGSLYGMMASAKTVSSAKEKELKELIRKADKLISNITTQTGAQVAALRDATEDADEVYARVGIEGYKKATISEVDGAIADLKAAVDNFNNPQGWYKEDGKWYYGIGAEIYADGWAQIGETWYMFNADGSLKQSEWFQSEGKWYWANANGGLAVGWAKVDGKWYFFDQGNAMKTGWVKVDNNWYYMAASGAMVTGWNWIGGNCYYFYNNGAMAANTTVGGYKVDANGVWVA